MFLKQVPKVILFLFILQCSSLYAFDAEQLNKIYDNLQFPKLQLENTYSISQDTIFHHDYTIILDSGRIAFFEPIVLNSDTITFGAYFEGFGSIEFKPSVQMERDHLKRFIGQETLNKDVQKLVLFFTMPIYDSLQTNLVPAEKKFTSSDQNDMKDLHNVIKKESDFLFSFELLRNIAYPIGRPYLVTNMQDDYIYMFNPYQREEVHLWNKYSRPGQSFTEQISSYSQYNTDESYTNINGRNKDQIDVQHYDLVSSIDRKGILNGKATLHANVIGGPLQFIKLSLLPTLTIDSVIDQNGLSVEFFRGKLKVTFKDWETNQFALVLNETHTAGDSVIFTFYYNGEIAENNLGEYYVFAGANWYPTHGFRDLATFDLTYKTDKQYTFTSCGYLLREDNRYDTLITKWSVKPKTSNISFNIGNLKKYTFQEDDVVPVEIFFSKELHHSIASYLARKLVPIGKNMEKQVADDIINAVRVFNHYFGAYPLPKLTISEILSSHGEAFPGFVHLGYSTWINTDIWGDDHLFRAHEVAHQWWGVGVGYETYHDQWLSEGFAEYSALLYYQAITDNKKFLNKLKDSRNNIFSVRNTLFSSGEESGPIALGVRTSSTETRGDFDLIIYKKGAFVLHMLRNLMIDLKTMNEDAFFNMLKEFYGLYRGKNATTKDFQFIAEKHTGIKLDWFFDQWVYHNYLPEYEFTYDIKRNNATNLLDVNCRIQTKGVPDNFKMYIPLEIQFDEKSKAYIRILVDSPDYSFNLPGLSSRPKKIILNPFESVLAKIKQ